jgi:RNA polymerase sigma-70 factor (sigma-E family)
LSNQDSDADPQYLEFAAAQAGQLFRIAYLMCGDWHEAQDLVQTTLAKLFVAWSRVRRRDSVSSYARTVLVNSYLSHRRLRRYGETPVPKIAEKGVLDADSDLRVTLLAALSRLPPRSRAVVVLRHIEDQSIESVSSYLRVTPAAVKSLNSRGLAQLREQLSADKQALRP